MEKGDDRWLITKSRCFDFSLVCVDLKVFICVDEYAIDFGIFFCCYKTVLWLYAPFAPICIS
jgi:hypothetical protein